ncbi:MAG: imidazolonepropionase [Armatimonadetes bacterium]|jgi:predicted amidohydrolase YtcJ|nr:imidazolonepropionase [Armatimonadota bacterium]
MQPVHFTNGRFITAEKTGGTPTELLASPGRIQELGTTLRGTAARIVDLKGRVVIPGPVDAHCHLVSYGMSHLREADLRGAHSLAELGERLHAQVTRAGLRDGDGRWLLARCFDQEVLPGGVWPSRRELDALVPDRPCRLLRVCGHALVANTPALLAAGLDPRERHGEFPEGVLTEEAMAPVHRAVPKPDAADWLLAARWACTEAARAGFVGIHSLMANAAEVRALQDLRWSDGLPVRVVMQLPYSLLDHAQGAGLRTGFGDDRLSIGAIKLFSDGSLGARTAALLEPYADAPGTRGELIFPPDELRRRVVEIYAAGFQACIHAIGDDALRVTLDALDDARRAVYGEGAPAHPPRVEHASLVNAELVQRMRATGAGAAIQPQFAWSDYWAPERLGESRARGCYAFRTLWEAGVPLAGSTDCPVEVLDAMAAIGQLVYRPSWSPDEGLPLEAAVRVFSEGSYTLRGGFPPGTGRLAPGELADFVVLEEDPRAVLADQISQIPVAMTVVGGEITYARE